MSSDAAPTKAAPGGPITVMLADDSATVRAAIRRALAKEGDIKVIAEAANGQAAIDTARQAAPQVIVLDIEMPILSGLDALPRILSASPRSRVVMASTLTRRGAAISLKALHLGASDYVAKPSIEAGQSFESFGKELVSKIRSLARSAGRFSRLENKGKAGGESQSAAFRLHQAPIRRPDVIAIGCSTGGPQALMLLLPKLVEKAQQPILIVQHMPPTFTSILAEHISRYTNRPCREATDGEMLRAGHIYVAPGDYHMRVVGRRTTPMLKLDQEAPENFCRPAVDPLFRSLVPVFGANVVACVLTGMGQDGLAGGRELVAAGGTLYAQDEATSVVWGMPGAVATAGICTAVMTPAALAERIGSVAAGTALQVSG